MFPSPFLFSRARFSVIPFVFSCAQFPPFPSFCVFVRLNFFFSPLCSHATQFSPFPFEFSRTLISPFPFVFSCHPISLFSLFSFLFTPPGVPAPLIFPDPLGVPALPIFSLFSSCFRSTRLSPFPIMFFPFLLRVYARPIFVHPFGVPVHPIFFFFSLMFPPARFFPFPFGVLVRPIFPFSLRVFAPPDFPLFLYPLGVPVRPTFPLSPWCSRAPDFLFLHLMFLHARFSPIPLVFPSAEFNEFNASVLLFIQNISNFLTSLPSRILSSKHLPFQHKKVEHDFRKLIYISILYEVNLPQIFRFPSF